MSTVNRNLKSCYDYGCGVVAQEKVNQFLHKRSKRRTYITTTYKTGLYYVSYILQMKRFGQQMGEIADGTDQCLRYSP